MTKKPNKYIQVNGQSLKLPKAAYRSIRDRKNVDVLLEDFIQADKDGVINAQDSQHPRHLRAIAKATD